MTLLRLSRVFIGGRGPSLEAVRRAVERGTTFLVAQQQPDGSFPLLRHPQGGPWVPVYGLFATTTVLLAVGPRLPREIIERAVAFVAAERRADGTWVWDPVSGRHPPDADDTACALAVCARYGSGLVSAQDAAVLRAFWRPGGPFKTWLAAGRWDEPGQDDSVVNCNVLLALQALGVEPTPAEREAAAAMVRGSERGTRHYLSPTSVAYAARRAGLLDADAAAGFGEVAPADPTTSALAAAEWLAAVRRWEPTVIARLLREQHRDGSWPAEPWCGRRGGTVWGSAAVTAALAVEALGYSIQAQHKGNR